MPVSISRLSKEYLFFPVTTSDDLTGATAELAFMADATALPGVSDWVNADIIGDVNSGYQLRVLIGPGAPVNLTPGDANPVSYQVWSKITDATEAPVRKPGVVTIE